MQKWWIYNNGKHVVWKFKLGPIHIPLMYCSSCRLSSHPLTGDDYLWGPLWGEGLCMSLVWTQYFQKLSFQHTEEEAMSLFSVTVTVSTHFCAVCHHFYCPVSLCQGHVACWNFTLTLQGLNCTQLLTNHPWHLQIFAYHL